MASHIANVGIIVPIILSFTWHKQVFLLGRPRSVYLLFFGFCLALVNCTSSVIPAMIGLVQVRGLKDSFSFEKICFFQGCWEKLGALTEKNFPPRFSVQVYLICRSVIMFISFVAFLSLWKQQRKDKKKKKQSEQKRIEERLKLTVITEQTTATAEPVIKEEKFDTNMKI